MDYQKDRYVERKIDRKMDNQIVRNKNKKIGLLTPFEIDVVRR